MTPSSPWLFVGALCLTNLCAAQPYYVSPEGNDKNSGSISSPFATLERAKVALREHRGDVFLRGGNHYLREPFVISSIDSGTKEAPVVFQNYPGETPVVSGGVKLQSLLWTPFKNGILQAKVPEDFATDELFINGERQVLARYPNVDRRAQYFDGFAADAISNQRAAGWANPRGGLFHAMHPSLWGDFTWLITGKDGSGNIQLEGGWQNNRGAGAHKDIRFVEGILEELDAPCEWFLDTKSRTLYYFPPAALDLSKALVEGTRLATLVEFRGDETNPVKWVKLRGLVFRQAARTVMENREPLLRSDWTIYRGGAVLFNGAEDCTLEDSFIDQVGGNAVFVNNYNRRIAIRGTHIAKAGASGICFVGDPKAARSALFNYHEVQDLEKIDRTPGPIGNNFPADCVVEDSLIHETGRVEKQTAGIEIDLAQGITVRHCSIYDLPRAGINIGDGCWGGHLIEYCDVFDTVKETGDHGSFNSWGRDRFWRPNIGEVNQWVVRAPDLPLLDAVSPIVIKNNRWRCDHGWAIDLDDGSSNYEIRNNLCLRGGIKNREGFKRRVENNILVDAGYDPHVWYDSSGDVFRRNIVWAPYGPANMPNPPWGEAMDFNLLHRQGKTTGAPAAVLQSQSGRDAHSIEADAQFADAARGDYRLKKGSPGLGLGFENFDMDCFGVQKAELRSIAREPALPSPSSALLAADQLKEESVIWLGARVRSIVGEGERSAYGLPSAAGVLVLEVPETAELAKMGVRNNDVILSINGSKCENTAALLRLTPAQVETVRLLLGVSRDQKEFVAQKSP